MAGAIFSEFIRQCREALSDSLCKLGLKDRAPSPGIRETSSSAFGELTSPICFDLSRELGQSPRDLARQIVSSIDLSGRGLVEGIEEAGGGYINFRLNYEAAAASVFQAVSDLGGEYGYLKTEAPLKIAVEHTSVNPIHPIHIGQARNSILGDALARLLMNRGHRVERRYYIDDMGRQSAILAYGYRLLGERMTEEKPDRYLGKIYSVTACLVEIQGLRRRIRELSTQGQDGEQLEDLNKELEDWLSVSSELSAKHPDLFPRISEKIERCPDAEVEVAELNRMYERNEPEAARLIRGVSELCLSGFRQTLSRMGIEFDSWDWESDLVWGGEVSRLVEMLKGSGYVDARGGVLKLDCERVVEERGLRGELGISDSHHLAPLTLVRSDGTTLYTTRDLAYTLSKFKTAERVINVVGAEQRLAQLQLKIALYAIGEDQCAANLVHFAFGLVDLPGYRMSSRRGRVITLDEVLDEATARCRREVEKRTEPLTPEERDTVAEKIALASVKYALLSVEPAKTVTFTWDRVLNLESNSAPFINYAYTRACGILRKIPYQKGEPYFGGLTHPLERQILLAVVKFPEVFQAAADQLRPESLTAYANSLAEKFHEYYEKVSIIRTEDPGLRSARRLLVNAVKVTLENCLGTLGIDLSERM